MSIGLTPESGVPEILVRTSPTQAVRYTVHAEIIDLGALEIERRGLEDQLAQLPTDAQLLEWARENYPVVPPGASVLQSRLLAIQAIVSSVPEIPQEPIELPEKVK